MAVVDAASVDVALAPLRTGFQADGADLAVEAATSESVVVRLIVTSETCAECVVPTPLLERILESTIRARFPDVGAIELIDPRR